VYTEAQLAKQTAHLLLSREAIGLQSAGTLISPRQTLWKQSNARVFGNIPQQWGTERIVESIIEEFKL
jgi:hypothetical protein